MKPPGPRQGNRGVTLVELLAALVISALVVVLASRLFLTGHRAFLGRLFETDRLSELARAKGALHQALRAEVAACSGGRLGLRTDSTVLDLAAWIKGRFPGADSLVFTCWEVAEKGGELVAWKDRYQPNLVAYRLVMRTRRHSDPLAGSILR